MPLFHIQDDDRPAFVVAENYAKAVGKWQHAIAVENDGEPGGLPQGVAHIADDEDIIVGQDFLAAELAAVDDGSKESGSATGAADKSPGEVAYEGYCRGSGGVSLISGASLPAWKDTKPEIRTAWESAASHVLQAMLRGVITP